VLHNMISQLKYSHVLPGINITPHLDNISVEHAENKYQQILEVVGRGFISRWLGCVFLHTPVHLDTLAMDLQSLYENRIHPCNVHD
jgi:hypothetical protein